MNVIILALDSIEYDLVKRFNCRNLMQENYGKVNLEFYLNNRPKGRGSGDPLTHEVFLTFITGIVPKESYNDMAHKINREYPTIFQFSKNPMDADVPGYSTVNKSWLEKASRGPLFKLFYRGVVSIERAEEVHFRHMEAKAEFADILMKHGFDIIMLYFSDPDHLQHMYANTYPDRYRGLYKKMDDIVGLVTSRISPAEAIILVFGDHGTNMKGGHSQHGFWSTNIPIGANEIELTKFYELIKKWYTSGPTKVIEEGLTTEEMEVIKKKLEKLGYFE